MMADDTRKDIFELRVKKLGVKHEKRLFCYDKKLFILIGLFVIIGFVHAFITPVNTFNGFLTVLIVGLLYLFSIKSVFKGKIRSCNKYIRGIDKLINKLELEQARKNTEYIKTGLNILKKVKKLFF